MTAGRVASSIVVEERAGPAGGMPDVGPPDPALARIEADLPRAVTADLAAFLGGKRAGCAEVAEEFVEAVDDLLALVLSGGKRLRPTFAWWAWRAAGGAGSVPAASVLRATSALELVQGCALVHDDLIDDSATRRGEPTVHARWQSRHRAGGWVRAETSPTPLSTCPTITSEVARSAHSDGCSVGGDSASTRFQSANASACRPSLWRVTARDL